MIDSPGRNAIQMSPVRQRTAQKFRDETFLQCPLETLHSPTANPLGTSFSCLSVFVGLCLVCLSCLRLVSPSPSGRRRFSLCVFSSPGVGVFVFLLLVFFSGCSSQDTRERFARHSLVNRVSGSLDPAHECATHSIRRYIWARASTAVLFLGSFLTTSPSTSSR